MLQSVLVLGIVSAHTNLKRESVTNYHVPWTVMTLLNKTESIWYCDINHKLLCGKYVYLYFNEDSHDCTIDHPFVQPSYDYYNIGSYIIGNNYSIGFYDRDSCPVLPDSNHVVACYFPFVNDYCSRGAYSIKVQPWIAGAIVGILLIIV